jgi:predicted alpha/beta hydrolase
METVELITDDGVVLGATRFVPEATVKAVIVLPAAMGVKQEFYAPFAEFLTGQGFAVLTFDYRGMGKSIPPQYRHSLRGFKADLFDWAEHDYNAALHAAKTWQPNAPLLVIGHSLGGQLPGLLPDNHLIEGMLTIAVGSGYWHYQPPKLKRFVWFLWFFAVPVYTRLFGYFPGKKVKKVGNLPKGVIYQWAQWCRSPHYAVDASGAPIKAGYENMRIPMLSISFTDDELMSRRSIDSLHDKYTNATQERRYIKPQEVGVSRIGHFGFFRPQFENTLWQQALTWLEQRAGAISSPSRALHEAA